MITSGHGYAAADLVPAWRLELILGAGQYPHGDNPDLFAGLVANAQPTPIDRRLRWPAARSSPSGPSLGAAARSE